MPQTIECLGLPATGKSWVLENSDLVDKSTIKKIELGNNLSKIPHTLIGISFYAKSIFNCLRLFNENPTKLQNLNFAKRMFVLFHRLGLLRTNRKTGILIDEGPVQSIWAIFYSLELTDRNKKLLKVILADVIVSDKVLYISTPSKVHLTRMTLRKRKHEIFNPDLQMYKHSRKWLYMILVELRQQKTNIQFFSNS